MSAEYSTTDYGPINELILGEKSVYFANPLYLSLSSEVHRLLGIWYPPFRE